MRLRGAPTRALLVLGLLLGLLAGCASGNQSGAVEAGQNPPAEAAGRTPAPALTVTAPTRSTSTAEQIKESRRRAEAEAKKIKKTANSVRKKATFTMPDLNDKNLQAAQDELQSRGSYFLNEVDATGKGRIQIVDRNWKVCSQTPKAGTKVLIARLITLRAVMLSEKCP
jgi:type IV pilus biogenesis protein CpaD/CtpE